MTRDLLEGGRLVRRTLADGSTVDVVEKMFGIRAYDVEKRAGEIVASDATEDRYGDVIEVEGWRLDNYRKNPVMLVDHDYSVASIVGTVAPRIEGGKLIAAFTLDPPESNRMASIVHNLLANRSLRAVSVGFVAHSFKRIYDDKDNWTGGYRFTDQELVEVSWVAVPANPSATFALEETTPQDDARSAHVRTAPGIAVSGKEKQMADAMETALQILEGQKRVTEKIDSVELSTSDLAKRLGVAEENLKEHKDFIAEIEERAAKARHGESVVDNLKAAIPERMRGMISAFARTGHKDPVREAAKEAWLKNHMKMQLPGIYGREFARLAEENDRLAQAMGEEKAYLNENTGAQGAYGVPTLLEADIYRVIEDNSLVRQTARKIMVANKVTTLVNVASNVTAYVVGELGTSITAGEPTFGSAPLTVKDWVAYGQATIDVLQDEAVGLLNFFAVNAGEVIGAKQDNEALEGTSTVTGLGAQTTTSTYTIGKIIRIDTTTATNSPTTPTVANLLKAVYGPAHKGVRRNAAWYVNPLTWASVIGQTSSAVPVLGGGAFWMNPNPAAPLAEGTLLGYPVYVTNQIVGVTEGAKMYFGAFGSQMVFGDRAGIDFAVSTEEKFQAGLIAMRVIQRTGIVVANAHGFSYIAKCPFS